MLPDEFSQGVVTAGDILRKMDENGVEKAVLLQGNYFGFQNLYSMEAVKNIRTGFVPRLPTTLFAGARNRYENICLKSWVFQL